MNREIWASTHLDDRGCSTLESREHYSQCVEAAHHSNPDARQVWMWSAGVALITLLVFQSVRHGALLAWDDDINITTNERLRALTWDNLRWMFTDFEYMRRYTPLTWLGWSLQHEFFGLSAWSCHIGNLVLHAANAVLVFRLVQRVMEIWMRHVRAPAQVQGLAGAIGALLWAVHPLRVEVVAWASGRIYCQAGFFLLLATLAYLNVARAAGGSMAQRGWFAASVAAFAASMLTYPLGLSYVGVLIIADIWLLRRIDPGAGLWRDARNRRVWLEKIPYVVVAAVIVTVTLVARFNAKGVWDPPVTLAEFGVLPRAAQAFYIWACYVWRPLVPVELAPVYTTLVRLNPGDAIFVLSAVGVLAVTALLFWRRQRWPGVFALWLGHLVLLVPVLGLTEQPHYPNDRYSYLPAVLWAPACAVGLVWLGARAVRRTIFPAAGALILTLAALSVAQIGIWRSSETLFRYLLTHVGESAYRADVAVRLGEVLREQGRLQEAAEYYRETLRIVAAGRRASLAHFGLGIIALDGGRTNEAAEHLQNSIRLRADFAPAYVALGDLFAQTGRRDEAIAALTRAIALDPQDGLARAVLARLRAP